MARLADGGLAAIQRELKQLTDAGIIRRTKSGHQVYFQANPDCPIAAELKGIIIKTAGAADVLRVALSGLTERISLALIYGSFARGQQHAESDVDLLVVGEVEFAEVVAALSEAQTRLSREVNPTVHSPDEFAAKIGSQPSFLKNQSSVAKSFS